jgi:hypothetical protein
MSVKGIITNESIYNKKETHQEVRKGFFEIRLKQLAGSATCREKVLAGGGWVGGHDSILIPN